MMKNISILGIILLFLVAACDNHKTVITGTLSEIESRKIYLYEVTKDGLMCLDSADLKNKNFKFVISTKDKKNPDDPFFYRLSQNPFNEINTIARSGETIDFQINNKIMVTDYTVSGGDDAKLMWELDRKLKFFIDTIDELYLLYEKNLYDDEKKKKLDEDYIILVEHHTEELIDFIEKNTHSFASLIAFYQSYNRRIFIPEDEHLDLLEKIFFSLREQYPAHQDVLYLENRINQKKQ
ncbi:DUF4369 domain-containing protein [Bacteroidales bacterium OttesenSCG-928-B11]|nr:DUF4369 domain-containing protein [Bacteroidales bacterium OttesenSCG-928-C03]MDL2311832.1 DUF4369 domain-containing protein [Bacteroidales bacterium OttesenSCG-928-B11]MDL2325519.1 DUF4369 domain-containing protein [Bacteroidales bacterium OttesenSCG-928-A14]